MMLACGKRIPASEHAVSLSLPTMRDVIGYEERSAGVFRHVCSGYPRFVRHWMVDKVQLLLRERYACQGPVFTLHDYGACERLMTFLGRTLEVLEGLPFGAVVLPDADAGLMEEAQRFQQHTGVMLSSRQAEDFLMSCGELTARPPEALFDGPDPAGVVCRILAGLYKVSVGCVGVYPSGMNAFFSVFETLNRMQNEAGRDVWLQVGWLYLDTTSILARFAANHVYFHASALDAMEAYFAEHHERVAGITTEVMTNPLLNTPDLRRLSALARRYGLPLIVDTSMPTPINVEVFPFADVVIESLTKFASGHGDVMSGALVCNPETEWGRQVNACVTPGVPYERDLRRMAHSIQGYAARMTVINDNALALVDFFRSSRKVREVHWAGQENSAEAYGALRRAGGGYGGVVSVVFDKPLDVVYDRLSLLKGPSFGTEFTLCMAYVFMVHYDLVTTSVGREHLRVNGIDPGLLRISVGMEPVGEIIHAFEKAL